MRRSRYLFVAVAIAGMLASGAVGVAVGASSVPTIKACVEKDGTMRYSSTGACHTGEKKLTWNVQGVAGARGATGDTGPQGPAGSGGTSGPATVAIYFANGLATQFGTAPITLASIRVPAGSYLVEFYGRFSGVGQGDCIVTDNQTADPSQHPQAIDSSKFTSTPDFPGFLDIGGYVEFSAPTTLYGRCSGAGNTPGLHLDVTAAKRLPGLPIP